jgi:alkaline phosphatase D
VSSCLKPNFPYAPFQNNRIKGFDLLADYLFAEPTVVDTPGTVAFVKADDNVTESSTPLENDVEAEAGESVPEVVPASLEAERRDVAPFEFMLFLVEFTSFFITTALSHIIGRLYLRRHPSLPRRFQARVPSSIPT